MTAAVVWLLGVVDELFNELKVNNFLNYFSSGQFFSNTEELCLVTRQCTFSHLLLLRNIQKQAGL